MRRMGVLVGVVVLLSGCTVADPGTPTPLPATATVAQRLSTPTPSLVPTVTPAATATAAPTITVTVPTPTPDPQVVTAKGDPVNVRASAAADAPILGTLAANADAPVLGEDTTGPDGATRWVHITIGGKEGYVRSDLVSAPHVVTPAPPTAIPPSASLPALQAWAATYGEIFTTITNDDKAVVVATDAQSLPAILTACRQLETDVVTAKNYPPIPDANTAAYLAQSYLHYENSAKDCIIGAQTDDAASFQEAASEIRLASNEMNLATAALKQAAGLP